MYKSLTKKTQWMLLLFGGVVCQLTFAEDRFANVVMKATHISGPRTRCSSLAPAQREVLTCQGVSVLELILNVAVHFD